MITIDGQKLACSDTVENRDHRFNEILCRLNGIISGGTLEANLDAEIMRLISTNLSCSLNLSC